MTTTGIRVRSAVIVSLVMALLLVWVVVPPSAGAHPGHEKGTAADEHGAAGVGVVVNSPEELRGFIPGVQWSGTAALAGQRSDLVYAGTGCTPAHYELADVEGKIAIIDDNAGSLFPGDVCQPTYTFLQKVQAAQEAGAIGLVQVERDDDIFEGDAFEADIPALAVTQTDGAPIRDAVIGDTDVNVTLPSLVAIPAERLTDVSCVDGQAGPFECDGIDLLAFVPLTEFEGDRDARQALGGGVSDLWGWTDPENGDEYVIVGKTNGVGFFRVTDPTDPVYLGELPNRAVLQLIWHDIKVYEDHAFIVSESNPHGMKVFDLTRLRGVDEPQEWDEDAFYPLPAAAHNVELNTETGYAYIVGGNAALAAPDQCMSGLHMVDVSSPTLPVFAGCYLEEGGPGTAFRLVGGPAEDVSPQAYVHDAQCVIYDGPDERYVGNEICFNSAERKVVIADVTDKLLPTTLGVTEYDMVGYTHQGWLTEDHRYLIVNDEADETGFGINTRTVVIDVTDLEDPKPHFYHTHDTRSITHNNYVHDGLVYMSNYTSGLRVHDVAHIGDPDDPRLEEIAFFDTFPAHGEPTFQGTWSNYPYFESGTIAVSGIDEGLFLLRLATEDDDDDPVDELAIACDDCPVDIRAGETGTATLAVLEGDADAIDGLVVDDVPEGWTVTPDADELTLTIEVPRNERAGGYGFTVTATTDGDTEASTEITVDVRKGPPSDAGPPGGPPGQNGQGAQGSASDATVLGVTGAGDNGVPLLPVAVVVALLGAAAVGVSAFRRRPAS